MGFGSSSSPAPPAPAPRPPAPPTLSDDKPQEAALAARRNQAMARGRTSTILTGGQGIEEAPNSAQKLLGE